LWAVQADTLVQPSVSVVRELESILTNGGKGKDMANKKEIQFDYGKVERQFTKEWANSGMIRVERIPDMVSSLVTSRGEMVEYIEA